MKRLVALVPLALLVAGCGQQAPATSKLPATAQICSESISGECWSSSEVVILPANGGQPHTLALPRAQYTDVAWSPDGKNLALVVNNQSLDVLDLASLAERTIASADEADSLATPAWSPDGTRLAYTLVSDWEDNGLLGGAGAARDTALPTAPHLQVMVVPAAGGDPHEVAHGKAPTWSPDGTRIAFTSAPGKVESIRADGTGLLSDVGWGDNPTWSPDGRTLFFEQYGDFGMTIYEAPASGGKQQVVIENGAVPRVSSTGELAYLKGDLLGAPTISDADGKNGTTLSSREASWLSWSPDGSELAVTFVHVTSRPPVIGGPGQQANGRSGNGGPPMAGVPTIDVGRP